MKKFYIGTGLWVEETSSQLPDVVTQLGQYCGNHRQMVAVVCSVARGDSPSPIPIHLGRAALSVLLGNHNYDKLTSPKAVDGTTNNHPGSFDQWTVMKLSRKLMLFHLLGNPQQYHVPLKQNLDMQHEGEAEWSLLRCWHACPLKGLLSWLEHLANPLTGFFYFIFFCHQ